MTAFHDVRFPVEVAFGATGGPVRKTEIVRLASGAEARNSRWAHSRRSFNAGTGIKTLDQLSEVISFFEERRGALHSFRYRDPLDFKSCRPSEQVQGTDQALGVGDATRTDFTLVKHYGSTGQGYERPISHPVAGSVLVAVNGTPIDQSAFDVIGNLVRLNVAPASGELVSAGFEFDVPVRFDIDELSINLAKFAAGDIPTVKLIEVRPSEHEEEAP